MVARFLYLLCFCVFLGPQIGYAQDQARVVDAGEPWADYQRSLRFSGIQADVTYYDPKAAAPSFDTQEEPQPVEQDSDRTQVSGGEFNLPLALITGGILFVVLFLFFRFGGASSVVLRREADNAKRDKTAAGRGRKSAPVDMQSFEGIVNNPNRQQALINLAQLLIYKAVSANDLLLQRSWTARDVLRRMPRNSSYLPELSELVLKGELVHFGERKVSEEEFADYAARAKPLLRQLST